MGLWKKFDEKWLGGLRSEPRDLAWQGWQGLSDSTGEGDRTPEISILIDSEYWKNAEASLLCFAFCAVDPLV